VKTQRLNDQIDRQIVRKLRQGDQGAFHLLYQQYAGKIFHFALRYLKTQEDAENLTQDIFLKIWENHETLNPDLSLNAYIFTITKNTIFNQNRKKVNEQLYLSDMKEYLDSCIGRTENDILLNEVKNMIDQAMDQLPRKRKKIFRLSRFECLSHREIAQQMNISEKTVEAHIRLALKSIRSFLNRNMSLILLWCIALARSLF